MKQKDLADLLGVTSKTISRWETGKYMPDLSLFIPISEILGLSLNELMQGERIVGKKNADSIEIEVKLEIEKDILKGVRINKVCEVKKNRDSFVYKNIFEISLDEVERLGYFVEVEIYDKNIPIKEANQLLLQLYES